MVSCDPNPGVSALKSMPCPCLRLSSFSVGRPSASLALSTPLARTFAPCIHWIHLLLHYRISLSGLFSCWDVEVERRKVSLACPALGRSLGIFSSLGRWSKKGLGFELALSALPPKSPRQRFMVILSSFADAAGHVYNHNQRLRGPQN